MKHLSDLGQKMTQDFWNKIFVSIIVLNVVVLVCIGFFSEEYFWYLCITYVFFINLMVLAIFVYRSDHILLKKSVYCIELLFVVWYVVCVVANGNPLLMTDFFQPDMAMLLGAACVALPMVDMLDDFDKKKGLDIVLLLSLLVLSVCVWLSVVLTFLRTSIYVGDKAVGYVIVDYYAQYPMLFKHQYFTAALSVIGVFIGIYFLLKKRYRIPAVLGLAGFILALSLVKCRSAMLGLAIGLMISGFYLIRSKAPDKKWTACIPAALKLLVIIIIGLILMWETGTLWANHLATSPEQNIVGNVAVDGDIETEAEIDYSSMQRKFSDQISTGTGRLETYSRIPALMAQGAPKSYIFGNSRYEIGQMYVDYLNKAHTHSVFFETMTQLGIPGMMIIIVLLFILWKAILKLAFRKTFVPLKPENCILPAIPAAFTVIGFFENFLFVNTYFYPHYYFYNLIFFIFYGYFIEMTCRINDGNINAL